MWFHTHDLNFLILLVCFSPGHILQTFYETACEKVEKSPAPHKNKKNKDMFIVAEIDNWK